jgi:riboflavin synthase
VVKTKKIIKLKNSWEYEFSFQNNLEDNAYNRFIVEKGSVAINGVSLTIANVYKNYFNVSIIPHTFLNTNLSKLKENDLVNIEFDPLARYMSKYYEK